MDIRVLKYFITVVKEKTILKAAERLHITQPTLSRQLMEMEDELGCKLFVRSNRKITMTSDGVFLYNRAKEIVTLMDKTVSQFKSPKEIVSGDIHIGCAETEGMRTVIKTMKKIRENYPLIRYRIYSGNVWDLTDNLDKGILDFCVFAEQIDKSKYHYLHLPYYDHWGVLMRNDSSLAHLEQITPQDLINEPLILSHQDLDDNPITKILKKDVDELNIAATYNLVYNATLMVEEGLGYLICYDNLVNIEGRPLCMKPLLPRLDLGIDVVWKKNHIFSRQSKIFIEQLQKDLLKSTASRKN